jgi:CBS domain-containing protein
MDRLDSKRVQVLRALEEFWGKEAGHTIAAEQVMTPEPVCVSAEASLPELVEIFQTRGFRHVLVTDPDGRLRGVISDRDVLRSMGPGTAYKEVLAGIVAGELMSTDLVTIGPRTPVTEAIVTMIDHGISCLPIVDEGRLLGIMTNTDLHVLLQMLLQALRLTGSEKPLTAAPR